MNLNLYTTSVFHHCITISARQLTENIDKIILDQLKNDIGNKCINDGYIDKDSVNIVKRSIGKINSSHLNGSINYNVEYNAKVCNPKNNDIITCKVVGINTMGLMTEFEPLTIVLPRQHHLNSELFKEIEIDDDIEIEIIGSRFDLYDTQITAIGKLIKKIDN